MLLPIMECDFQGHSKRISGVEEEEENKRCTGDYESVEHEKARKHHTMSVEGGK